MVNCNHKFVFIKHEDGVFGRKIILFCEKCGKYTISKKMEEDD